MQSEIKKFIDIDKNKEKESNHGLMISMDSENKESYDQTAEPPPSLLA